LLQRRCLVPASRWIEWQAIAGSRKKAAWRLAPADCRLFSFAGLMSDEAFVILTAPAAPATQDIHPRMPVVLDAAAEAAWLNDQNSIADVQPFLLPYAGPIAKAPVTEARATPAPRTLDLFE
jgi:putative SOS response-associated peptidase YedK